MPKQRGFTYLLALLAVALLGLTAMRATPVLLTEETREKEEELIFIGGQFRNAIAAYYLSTPGTVKRFPRGLDELLKDPRFIGVKRHLRRVPRDPFSGIATWGIVRAPDGGVSGVFSLYEGHPIKQSGFFGENIELNGRRNYREWRFVYTPVMDVSGGQKFLMEFPGFSGEGK